MVHATLGIRPRADPTDQARRGEGTDQARQGEGTVQARQGEGTNQAREGGGQIKPARVRGTKRRLDDLGPLIPNAFVGSFGFRRRSRGAFPSSGAGASLRRVAEKLAAQDPSNAGWQRDVWISMWRLANADVAAFPGPGSGKDAIDEGPRRVAADGRTAPRKGPHFRSCQLSPMAVPMSWVGRAKRNPISSLLERRSPAAPPEHVLRVPVHA